jgi:phosphatidylglycerophosphatase A
VPSSPEVRRPGDGLVLLLATGLGAGAVRKAPGTVGSLWGPPLVWGLQEAGLTGWSWGAAGLLIALLGIPLCGRAATILGRKDPGSVVYDEIAAFPVVFAMTQVTLMTAVLGFGLFRLFDIVKPWPIRRFERLPGGWGIMLDDLIAGVYAGALLWGIDRWLL